MTTSQYSLTAQRSHRWGSLNNGGTFSVRDLQWWQRWYYHIPSSFLAGIMVTQRKWVLGIWSPSQMMVGHDNVPLNIFLIDVLMWRLFNVIWFSHIPGWAGHKCPTDWRRAERAPVCPTGGRVGLPITCRGVWTHHQGHWSALYPWYVIISPLRYPTIAETAAPCVIVLMSLIWAQ